MPDLRRPNGSALAALATLWLCAGCEPSAAPPPERGAASDRAALGHAEHGRPVGDGGRQFVVIAAGGHNQMRSRRGDSVIAFALPD